MKYHVTLENQSLNLVLFMRPCCLYITASKFTEFGSCPWYDTCEASVLELWGVWSHFFIAITPWPTLLVPVWILSMNQVDLFENYEYQIGILETI